jgi:hypothetical protein
MAESHSREECVYLAKLAEQAERYDEMVEEMKKVCLISTASDGGGQWVACQMQQQGLQPEAQAHGSSRPPNMAC